MTEKAGLTTKPVNEQLEIAHAVERYVAQGGIISVVAAGESATASPDAAQIIRQAESQAPAETKIERFKGLVAKGAGVTALQYSLKMKRKEVRRMASENGVKIVCTRPVRGTRSLRDRETTTVDDTVAGHAMHYSALGYTVPEIAQLLNLSVRDIWNIGKAYRFEFNNPLKIDNDDASFSDAPNYKHE
jgi:hypothetical protein